MPIAQDGPLEPSEVPAPESQNRHILVSTPRCLRLSSLKKAGVQEVLRSKFNRIQQGLSKKRDVLVQNASGVTTYEQPTFYIPTPIACLEPELASSRQPISESASEVEPLLGRKSSLQTEYNTSASFIDGGSHTCDQKFDSIPIEPEPDYDDFPIYSTNSLAQRRLQQRWSALIVDEPRRCNLESFKNIAHLTVETGIIPKVKLNNNNHDLRAQSQYASKRTSVSLNADFVAESVEQNKAKSQNVVSNGKQKSNMSQSSLNKQLEQASVALHSQYSI